jgi:hypothetical protein
MRQDLKELGVPINSLDSKIAENRYDYLLSSCHMHQNDFWGMMLVVKFKRLGAETSHVCDLCPFAAARWI